jgi:hypothetical protein
MTPEQLRARTKKFAVDVIRFAKGIPKDHINDEMASQLTDAATSTAAQTTPLWKEADELTRILVRSRETARRNREKAISKKSPAANHKSPTNR